MVQGTVVGVCVCVCVHLWKCQKAQQGWGGDKGKKGHQIVCTLLSQITLRATDMKFYQKALGMV